LVLVALAGLMSLPIPTQAVQILYLMQSLQQVAVLVEQLAQMLVKMVVLVAAAQTVLRLELE
tara:strand:- start:389 stop:574 length:186 start_codon:yes stop_codon:yes gene_type:complete